jgi:hypothetical protein
MPPSISVLSSEDRGEIERATAHVNDVMPHSGKNDHGNVGWLIASPPRYSWASAA